MRGGQSRKRGFYIHLTAYVLVNAVLVAINLPTTPDRLWVQWPLMGCGIGVVAHAAAFMFAGRKSAAPSAP